MKGMRFSTGVSVVALAVVTSAVVTSRVVADNDLEERPRGVIVGQVLDPQGSPIDGVVVSTGGGPSAVTNPGGVFALQGVKQTARLGVTFAKVGYATTAGIARFTCDDDDCDDGDAGDWGDDDEAVLDEVTLTKVMVAAGDIQTLDAAAGGTARQRGFRVTFPPRSLRATGTVEVALSPIDVSTNEIGAFPGDFTGVTVAGQRTQIETFSAMDVRVTQNGAPVRLRRGAAAKLEFLLPDTTSLRAGETVPLWYYDEVAGLWREEGAGIVDRASTAPGRLAVFGEVSHFTWWNCDQPISTQTCLSGRVTDLGGVPVGGAEVIASGIDYNGSSHAYADPTGAFCVNVKRASRLALTARLARRGVVQSRSVVVNTADVQRTCAGGVCTAVPSLQFAGLSCIAGDVYDGANNPVDDAVVASTGGGVTRTGANGTYCLLAPADQDATVFSPGFGLVTVPAGSLVAGSSCAIPGSGCATANLREPKTPGASCVRGNASFYELGPIRNELVVAYLAGTDLPIGSAVTDDNGDYCMSDLPSNQEVLLELRSECSASTTVNTGAPGTCQANTCSVAPQLVVCPPALQSASATGQ